MKTTRKILATTVRKLQTAERTSDKLQEHEVYRWSYMTVAQMTTRLSRITKPEKLRNFISMALAYGEHSLARAARAKLRLMA